MSNTKKSYLLFEIDDLKKCFIEKVKESPMSISFVLEVIFYYYLGNEQNETKVKYKK